MRAGHTCKCMMFTMKFGWTFERDHWGYCKKNALLGHADDTTSPPTCFLVSHLGAFEDELLMLDVACRGRWYIFDDNDKSSW